MKPIALLALLLVAIPAKARPKHWYARWQTYVGVGIMVGANLVDAKTTCDRPGYQEQRFGHGCATAIGLDLGNTALAIGLYSWEQHYGRNADWKPEIFMRDWSLPIIEGSIMGAAAIHNATLPKLGQ